jgi:phosphatidylinositol-3-phosphatase
MENQDWSNILNSPSAPYINQTLLPISSYTQQYHNPPRNHPSEPNYLWLEAGTSFGIKTDGTPEDHHQSTTDHLVTYLDKSGISWKAYIEGISGKECPLQSSGLYVPRHNPMVYFDNVTNTNDPKSAYCIAHERPYSGFSSDLKNNKIAQYNYLSPDLCHDMHDSKGCDTPDKIKNGDTWLSKQIPLIMNSKAYKQGGVIFITWDEAQDDDHPIGMIVLSPFAKGGGYSNSTYYDHSSTLLTIEEIFNIKLLLGDSAKATDLRDLFSVFP